MAVLLKKFFLVFRSTVARATLGATTLSMLAWFLWPDSSWQVHPDALAAFTVALLAWIGSEIPPTVNKGSPHDRQLFKDFQELLSDGERDFLKTHDFGGSFNWTRLHGLHEIAYVWRGTKYEFDNKEIQQKFGSLIEDIENFIHDLAVGTWRINNTELSTAIPDTERVTENASAKTYQKVTRFNQNANKLYLDINQFIRIARPIISRE